MKREGSNRDKDGSIYVCMHIYIYIYISWTPTKTDLRIKFDNSVQKVLLPNKKQHADLKMSISMQKKPHLCQPSH